MPQTESTPRLTQLVAPADELMDIDGLIMRFQKGGHRRAEAFAILKDYLAIQTDLPIGDGPMRRICQVMTSNGCIAADSCEGHERYLPSIHFHVRHLDALENFAYFLRESTSQRQFNWAITVQPKYNSDPSNPFPLDFILQPVARHNELIDPSKDRNLLMLDIHYLGAASLSFFNKK